MDQLVLLEAIQKVDRTTGYDKLIQQSQHIELRQTVQNWMNMANIRMSIGNIRIFRSSHQGVRPCQPIAPGLAVAPGR